MKYSTRPATADDVIAVLRNLREADRREAQAVLGDMERLYHCTIEGEVYVSTIEGDEVPFLLFGVSPDPLSTAGRVWLLATDRVSAAPRAAIRLAREWLPRWHSKHPTLHNVADCRNTLHLRWLKLMGFSFGGKTDVNGLPFQYFYMTSSNQCVPQSQQQ